MFYSLPFYKIIVPTVDTVRYEYLISKLLSAGSPVALVGKVGTGKSSTASSVIETFNKEKYSTLSINLSAQVSKLSKSKSPLLFKYYVYVCIWK